MAVDTHILPKMGYGTWMRRGRNGQRSVEEALEIGYRHIDTAQGYENEAICGLAIERSGLARKDVFITTKVKPQNLGRSLFLPTVEESLVRLRTDHVDMLLIHWPSPKDEFPLESYIEDLAQARGRGYAKHVGLSNFTKPLLLAAEKIAGAGIISNLQIEIHPFHQNRAMVDFCRDRGIHITAFSPLALGRVVGDPDISRIASKRRATPSQIALAYLMAKNFAVIPASSKPEHMGENFAAAAIELSPEEMNQMDGLDTGLRLLNPEHAPLWD